MQFDSSESVMQHALQLARRGLGAVEPNPPVGAVIVNRDLQRISEGWHQRYGGPHAEVHALAAAGPLARGGTLFCTLEPCSHFGKTPPCADAIIAAGIDRVMIGTGDPATHVNGRGIEKLRMAGITVEVGVCEAECQRLIAPFRKLMLQSLPWVHAKWAMSLDGRIATHTGDSKWITNELARSHAHLLRGRCDAILAGIGTVLHDDPALTARPKGPRVATRVILDSQARIPLTSQLVQSAREVPVLLVASLNAAPGDVESLRSAGVEVIQRPGSPTTPDRPSLCGVLEELGRRKMTHVLIEGGAELLGAAFDAQVVDECHVYLAPCVIGGAGALSPLGGQGVPLMSEVTQLFSSRHTVLGDNLYLHGDISHGD